MKRKSLEVVLSLFNKHHDARNPANPSKQPKNGERVRLYQTGTLFTSAGLIEREPAAELYINFFHMVDVAGQPTDEGGKGKEKASSEKDNNNKPLEFSMNNTGSLYDEKQDKVKIRASFDFTIPVFAALYHLYKRKLLVLQQYFTLYTNQRQKCNDILGLTLPPLFPRCTNLPNLTSGTAQTLRNTSWYFRDDKLRTEKTRMLSMDIAPKKLIKLVYKFDAHRRQPAGSEPYSTVLKYVSGDPIERGSSNVDEELDKQIPYDDLISTMKAIRRYSKRQKYRTTT